MTPRFERTPGEWALLRLKLARAAFEAATQALRLRTAGPYGGTTAKRRAAHAAVRAADGELSRAIREMEALP